MEKTREKIIKEEYTVCDYCGKEIDKKDCVTEVADGKSFDFHLECFDKIILKNVKIY